MAVIRLSEVFEGFRRKLLGETDGDTFIDDDVDRADGGSDDEAAKL